VLLDPPWDHYGAPDKWAAAGKHYKLMPDAKLLDLPIMSILAHPAVVFLWCTSSTLARAIGCFGHWGLHYRGVAFVWVKTRMDGIPIGAQGVRPSITKPLTEFVIVASTQARGRPLRLANEGISQTVFAQRSRHSEKPEAVQDAIDAMYPNERRAELFARRPRENWVCWGDEVTTQELTAHPSNTLISI
jgi:N6-adenosine-specific RNA methylase IME4